MPADHDVGSRMRAARGARQRERAVVLDRVHARQADETGLRPRGDAARAAREAGVEDGRPRADAAERRGDVLEAERLDLEERPQPEAVVSRERPDEEDVHRGAAHAAGPPPARSPRAAPSAPSRSVTLPSSCISYTARTIRPISGPGASPMSSRWRPLRSGGGAFTSTPRARTRAMNQSCAVGGKSPVRPRQSERDTR